MSGCWFVRGFAKANARAATRLEATMSAGPAPAAASRRDREGAAPEAAVGARATPRWTVFTAAQRSGASFRSPGAPVTLSRGSSPLLDPPENDQYSARH